MGPSPRLYQCQLVLLPLCTPHRLLPAAPSPWRPWILVALLPPCAGAQVVASDTGHTTTTHPIAIPSVTNMHSMRHGARLASHSPWIASTSTLWPCHLFHALYLMHCQTPIRILLCRLSTMLCSPMTHGALCLSLQVLMLWLASGSINTNCSHMGLLIAIRRTRSSGVSHSGPVWTMMKLSGLLLSLW
jgi:hypothetical protein